MLVVVGLDFVGYVLVSRFMVCFWLFVGGVGCGDS
jgi:hypothetical protein